MFLPFLLRMGLFIKLRMLFKAELQNGGREATTIILFTKYLQI